MKVQQDKALYANSTFSFPSPLSMFEVRNTNSRANCPTKTQYVRQLLLFRPGHVMKLRPSGPLFCGEQEAAVDGVRPIVVLLVVMD